MRILQLGRFYPPDLGGIETVIFEIVEGLNASNIRCDVLCSNKVNRLDVSNFGRYKVTRAPSLALLLSTAIAPSLIFQLKEIIKDYDIIHLHHPDPMATLALLICHPQQKIIVHWHSDIVRQKFALIFYRPIQEMLLRKCNKIIVTSNNYLESSVDLKKFKDKAEIVPIGINADMSVNHQMMAELKMKFHNRTVIFSLGRHVYYKGFDYLIESAKYLDDSFVIIIGGEGPLTSSLRQQVEDKGLGSRIFFTGKIPVSELHSYFEICDIFCLSSIERSEAFGVVLLEAMSLGKPIVATKIPGSGVHWVNQDNETGLNVEPQNAEALAQAFLKISSDSELRQKFAVQSKLRYQNRFTRKAMVDQLINLYSRVLQQG